MIEKKVVMLLLPERSRQGRRGDFTTGLRIGAEIGNTLYRMSRRLRWNSLIVCCSQFIGAEEKSQNGHLRCYRAYSVHILAESTGYVEGKIGASKRLVNTAVDLDILCLWFY